MPGKWQRDRSPHSHDPEGLTPEDRRALRRARRIERRLERRERNKRRLLVTISILPSLLTLGNGLLGFAAIHLATRAGIEAEPRWLGVAAWLLFAAMVCDLLDGRLARFARKTSDFGGQLDSMCDVISFGVAPAVLMVRAVMAAVHSPQVSRVPLLWRLGEVGVERVLWLAGGIYVAGAVMRLARFNVENEPAESAHMSFRGLPSPGAAAAVATLVLLLDRVTHLDGGWAEAWLSLIGPDTGLWIAAVLGIVLPIATFLLGLLMVSNFQYPHVVNQYIRGRRPFGYLVKLLLLAAAVMLEPFLAMAVATLAFAAGPPVKAVLFTRRRAIVDRPAGKPSGDEDAHDEQSIDVSGEPRDSEEQPKAGGGQ